jgi:osmotically-inducible protein OsmY
MRRHEKEYRQREQQPYRNRQMEGREFNDYTESLDRRAMESSRGEGGYFEGRGFYPERGFEGRQRFEDEMYDDRRFSERNQPYWPQGGMPYGGYGDQAWRQSRGQSFGGYPESWRNRYSSQWQPSRGQMYRQHQQFGQFGGQQYAQPPWIGRYSGESYLRPEDQFEDDYGFQQASNYGQGQHFGQGQMFGQGLNRPFRQDRQWGTPYGSGFMTPYQGTQMGQGLQMGQGSQLGQNTGKGPRGFTRSDDRIKEDICERLTDNPEIDATDIEIRVQNGEVTLTGTVDERWTKRMAEDIAESVSGVKQIQNQIRFQENQSPQSQSSGRQGPGAETGGKRTQEHETVGAGSRR